VPFMVDENLWGFLINTKEETTRVPGFSFFSILYYGNGWSCLGTLRSLAPFCPPQHMVNFTLSLGQTIRH
jgi:hypothetical protein